MAALLPNWPPQERDRVSKLHGKDNRLPQAHEEALKKYLETPIQEHIARWEKNKPYIAK